MHDLSTTLVAVATPPGRGGVGCVRISGPRAVEIGRALFRGRGTEPPPSAASSRPRFGRFLDRDRKPLDHGFLVMFPVESAFTGESTVELWPHGSPAVLAELVEAAIACGAEPAGPGEFTYRALRNGRLDLARAEAVRDLVNARTLYQARIAFSQAEGAVAERLAPLRESLEEWIARGEAAIEFVEESETHLPSGELPRAIERIHRDCLKLLAGFRAGRLVREGATLVVTGVPNVGKSSIFNALLRSERAIVTPSAGTTRDTVAESLDLDGIPVRLVDTAGLRETGDAIESEGVRRAKRAREEADVVLLALDGSRPLTQDEVAAVAVAGDENHLARTVVVVNKCDLSGATERIVDHPEVQRISALTGSGVDELRRELRRRLLGAGPIEDPVITDARHARALEQAAESLERALAAHESGLTEELVLEDLRRCMLHLGEITGEFTTDDLYDRVFSTFCIGK